MSAPETTKQLLNRLEKQADEQLRQAISVWQNMKAEQLLASPSEKEWSMAQCLWHLNSYGNYYLPLIAEKLKTSSTKSQEFKSTWLGSYFTRMMQPKAGMKKYKAFKDHVPPAVVDAHYELAEFIRQMEQLISLLRKSETKDMNAIRIPISITKLVRLKLGDVFGFILAHNERHIRQMKRLM